MSRLRSTDAAYTITRCDVIELNVSLKPLPFERNNTIEIARHWQGAKSDNPALFNGRIFMASAFAISGQTVQATCHAVNFATLMYWRDRLDTDGTQNIFGNIVLRASDGALVMGRMAPHTSIAGKVCYPGGSFDDADVRDGLIDASACATRECLEETGIRPDAYTLADGFVVCSDDRMIAVSRIGELKIEAEAARAQILRFMDRENVPEFDDIIIVRSTSDAERLIPDRYERDLALHLFQETPV